MDNITIAQIVQWGGTIVALGGVIAYFVKPVKDFSKRVDKIEEHQDNDNQRLITIEKDEKMILRCLNVLLLHMESGNNTGELKKQKQELDEYMINR